MEYSILVTRSRRARRVSLRVTRTGEVKMTIPIWSSKRAALAWAATRHQWIVASLERIEREKVQNPPLSDEEVEALRKVAKQKLPKALEQASLRTGLRYGRLTIRQSYTRWGSCTRKGNISLSLFLAALPDELIDYVCVHELCHTEHPNHSAAFHDLVNYHLQGKEKELQKKLKNYLPR